MFSYGMDIIRHYNIMKCLRFYNPQVEDMYLDAEAKLKTLNRTERKIFNLAAEGYSSRDIANQLPKLNKDKVCQIIKRIIEVLDGAAS